MGSGIFTRKTGNRSFMTRFSKAVLISQDSALASGAIGVLIKKLLLVLEKITQFGIILSHHDKASNPTHEHTKKQAKKTNGRGAKKRKIFSKIVSEVGERKMRGGWRIM